MAKHKPNPLSTSMLLLYPILLVAFMNSAANGFDGNTFGGVSAIADFQARFGTNVAASDGFLAAIYILGNVIGSFVAGPAADWLGRKRGMILANIIVLIGTIVQAAAMQRRDMIAGRVVLGIGSVMLGPSATSYVVEMSYPAYRGTIVGLYNGCYFIGAIVSTWLEYGLVDDTKGEINWRIPMAMQGIPCIIVLAFVWFLPESPRWLMARGREEEAKRILIKYHGEGDPDNELVQLEMEEMHEAIDTAGSDTRWWDYRELFNTRGARHRMFLVLCVGFFGQIDLPPTSYYMPLMAQTAGIVSTKQQLLMNALQSPVMTIGTLLGVHTIDKYGRRPMLIVSSAVCSLCVLIIIICSLKQEGHPSVGLAGISFVYVFLFAFAFVWTPMQALYPSEVLAYNARAKGLGMSGLWINIVSFINTYAAPVGITNSGWKFYFLYFVIDVVGIITIYFFFIETKDRSLEEIDEIFADPHPVRTSLRKQKISVAIEKS
ncbi:MFS lactose permease [Dacryopinax primogenitus]|uniref:MFS lactose permease n=1 Tax=Dacryopinax primogenitus (strain DJM 731) TaxID=1858805 RepID=M5G759_DACPD|nr:MFS lactose permease [Dacryopinax primogenitus]EJU06076.1 MFS lactose permease [Dacryopinax primogenitus]